MAKILVVDDETTLVMLMRFILEKAGHTVTEAHNGQEALEQLGVRPENASASLPDLVILDVMMPVVDGHAVARAMSARAIVSRIPILVVTAKGDMRQLFEDMPQVSGFLQKPFDPKVLRDTIAKLLPAG